jgi:hypothetical protein
LALNSVLQGHRRLPVCCRRPRRPRGAAGFTPFISLLRPEAPAGWRSGSSRRHGKALPQDPASGARPGDAGAHLLH